VTLHDTKLQIATSAGGTELPCKAAFLNANGFTQFSSAALLIAPVYPQEAIWNQYAAMYDYYMVERIDIEWHPTRI
jgi:hypothetical protein